MTTLEPLVEYWRRSSPVWVSRTATDLAAFKPDHARALMTVTGEPFTSCGIYCLLWNRWSRLGRESPSRAASALPSRPGRCGGHPKLRHRLAR